MAGVLHDVIEAEWERIGNILALPDAASWLRFVPGGMAEPWLDVDDPHFDYVVSERGSEIKRVRARDLDELMYLLTRDVAFVMASRYAAKKRDPARDGRRLLFAEKLRLLEAVSPRWADVERTRLDAILREHPYSDSGHKD